MIKLIKELIRLHPLRKRYKIKWNISFGTDTDIIFLFPTIVIQPWIVRHNGVAVINISWLHMHIAIGTWGRKGESQG